MYTQFIVKSVMGRDVALFQASTSCATEAPYSYIIDN